MRDLIIQAVVTVVFVIVGFIVLYYLTRKGLS